MNLGKNCNLLDWNEQISRPIVLSEENILCYFHELTIEIHSLYNSAVHWSIFGNHCKFVPGIKAPATGWRRRWIVSRLFRLIGSLPLGNGIDGGDQGGQSSPMYLKKLWWEVLGHQVIRDCLSTIANLENTRRIWWATKYKNCKKYSLNSKKNCMTLRGLEQKKTLSLCRYVRLFPDHVNGDRSFEHGRNNILEYSRCKRKY